MKKSPLIVAVESLSAAERAVVSELQRAAAPTGVVVNVMRGPGSADLRPLVLEGQTLFVIRPCDTGLKSQPDRYAVLREIYRRVDHRESLSWGEYASILWIKRPYYQKTLAELIEEAGSGLDPLPLISELVTGVRSIHQQGGLHGHLYAGNVAVVEGTPVFLDLGFTACATNTRTFGDSIADAAPELMQGAPVSVASDVFGLGRIVSALLPASAPYRQQMMVRRMVSADVAARPPLSEIAREFEIESVAAAPRAARALGEASPDPDWAEGSGVSSGRLLKLSPSQPAQESFVRMPPEERRTVMLKPGTLAEWESAHESSSLRPRGAKRSSPEERASTKGSSDDHDAAVPAARSAPVGFYVMGAVIIAAACALIKLHNPFKDELPLQQYWLSGTRQLMEQVAFEAIERPNSEAADFVIRDLLAGSNRGGSLSSVIKFVFHPAWRELLSERDRQTALAIALQPLMEVPPELGELQVLHPVVLLALAGSLPLDQQSDALKAIPLAPFQELPAPFGASYAVLAKFGAATLGEAAPRALAHVLLGDLSEPVMAALLGEIPGSGTDAEALALGRIRALHPLCGEITGLELTVLEFVTRVDSAIGRRVRWFDEQEIGLWKNTQLSVRLGLVASLLPLPKLSLEQYADLMAFPSPAVRKAATVALKAALRRPLDPIVEVLSSSSHQFNRIQVVALLSALQIEGDQVMQFMGTWFASNPDPQSVVSLLTESFELQGIDSFSVEAARYLKDKEWQASVYQLRKLARHRDTLARALAYARLNPESPEEAAILKDAARREPSEKLKEKILQKLRDSEPTN